MIPKVIHYCWFGRGEKPALVEKCIRSWKSFCPDYKIVEWNEDNFDINCCDYVKEAYNAKKYAFVSDYARLYVLNNYGGIYMDTDVEVKKRLDPFLIHQAFSGFESETQIPTGIMAAEKGFKLFSELLNYYRDRHFLAESGLMDTTTNVIIITKLLSERGFVPNGMYQEIEGFALYPRDYFCPLDNSTGVLYETSNTATIHWFNKSWVPKRIRIRSKLTRIIHRWFGVDALKAFRKKH